MMLQLPKKYNTHQAKAEVNIGLRGYLNQRIDRIDRKKKPSNNCFIIRFSDELIQTFKLRVIKRRFQFEAITKQIEKRDISFGDLFLVQCKENRILYYLLGHVQVNIIYY